MQDGKVANDMQFGMTEAGRVSELESCKVALFNGSPLKCADGQWRQGNELSGYAQALSASISPYPYLDRRYGLDQQQVMEAAGQYKNPAVIRTINPIIANR